MTMKKTYEVVYAQTLYHSFWIEANCEEEAYELTLNWEVEPHPTKKGDGEFVEVSEVNTCDI